MSRQDSDEAGTRDGGGDGTETSDSGVAVEGYETHNAPREQTQALLEAESPDDVDDGLIKEIEEERDRRLDPDNRPDNVEVDNTSRVFVPAEAKFEDSEIDQDPGLGQEGLAPVGGDSGSSDGSDDADGSHHVEPDVESGDPKDATTTQTSGTSDPTDDSDGPDRSDAPGAAQTGGKHKA